MGAPCGPVLVVAEELDPATDLIVQALADRSIAVLRFDLTAFPQHLALSAEHGSDRPGWHGFLDAGSRMARLEEVRAVYYARPGLPRVSRQIPDAYREWAGVQALVGVVQVLSSLPVQWMHHPDVHRAAAHKPAQLVAATGVGLTVPRTLVTNRVDEARRWARSVGGPLVCKPLTGGALPQTEGRPVMLPTRRIEAGDLDEGVDLTAHLFQEWIPKACEVRLTVVGDVMFPVAIHAGSEEATVDWRADYNALEYEPTTIPGPVAEAVRRFMAHYRLAYGAFDFAVTPDGQWVFFECNPAGQWQFIAAATNLPIAEAHADLLQGALTA
ncbi:ATP-grasp ribosomal peptide maturase [Streptomyces sp. NPDC048845]|uniref:ATP-grasp ribosomal peptide maturase n=1 Tax=Streptomyces sp. NPDC048845 TaxID=3155390 RepID=UPI00343417D1